MTAISPVLILVLAAVFFLGLIPAVIANIKGHPFVAWWLYGAFLFPLAFPHAILSRNAPRVAPHFGGGTIGGNTIGSHAISAVRRRDPPGPRLWNRDAGAGERGLGPTGTIPPTVDAPVASHVPDRATTEDEDRPDAPFGHCPVFSDSAAAIAAVAAKVSESGRSQEAANLAREASTRRPVLSPPRLDFDRSTSEAPVVDAPWTDEDFARIADGHIRRDRTCRGAGAGREICIQSAGQARDRRPGGISASWAIGAALAFTLLLAGYFGASNRLDAAFARHGTIEDGMARAISNIRIAFATFISSVADEMPGKPVMAGVMPVDKAISPPNAAPGSRTDSQYGEVVSPFRLDSESANDGGGSHAASTAATSPKASTSEVPLATRKTIKRVQAFLRARGYDVGPIDGKMGPQTQAAILAYQHKMGLAPTAAIDHQLLANLESSRPFRAR